MLALVLVGALIAQSAVGAPNRCDYCDAEPVTSGAITSGRTAGKAYSSYSSYGSQSSWSSGTGIGSRNGLGSTGGRIENLDENGIGSAIGGLERPGNWEDKKHYVTDDGRGEMSYRAGQTVTNNGFSKFAQHSYRYGTHDNHQPKPDSQILSTAEFEGEFQSMRQRISNFMSNFRLDTGSIVNANFLQDFTAKANLMTSQMNNVCNQVDVGSQMYQQMQTMIEQFRRDVEQRQREIESVVYQSSSNSNLNVNADWSTYPSTYPSSQPSPAPIQYPTRPSVNTEVVVTQQIEQQLNVIHNLVAKFASSFSRPESTPQFQSNLDAEIREINQKITDISSQALQHESVRARYEQLKTYFESCVSSIRTRIEEIDRRNREIERERIQREQELRLEAERKAEERRLEQIRIQEENERIRIQEENERIRIQEENERIRIQEETERLRIQENERIQREQYLAQQQQQQQQILLQQQQQQQLQLQQQQKPQQYQPSTHYPSESSLKVSGSIEHTYSGSYEAQLQGSTGGSSSSSGGYTQHGGSTYQRPQSASVPEVDIIAATNRLQQDLNRLQNEVNRFNSFSMRLNSANSASIVSEAESTAANLQSRINSLCDTSNKYQNTDVYNLAEELRLRLQGYLQNFKSQAASYTSQYNSQYSQSGQFASSGGYQSSAKYGSVQAPKVSNVEYEHSQSTDVEIGGRNLPNDGVRNSYGRVGRYARSVGEEYGPYFDSNQHSIDYEQQQKPILNRDYEYRTIDESNSYDKPYGYDLRDPKIPDESDSYDKPYGYNLRDPKIPDSLEDDSQRTGSVELQREYQPARAEDFRQGVVRHQKHQKQRLYQTHQIEDLTYQPGAVDDYYTRQHSQDPSTDSQWEGENESTQQHVRYGESEDLENLDRPRSQKIDSSQNVQYNSFNPNAGVRAINQLHREENQRQQINQHLVGEYGKPNASGEKGVLGTYSKFESAQRTEELTLEKSGFNDYSDRNENSKLTTQQIQPITYDNLRLEHQTEEPQWVRPISVQEKFEYTQKTENLSLEQSGFYDHQKSSEKPSAAQQPQTIVGPSGKIGSPLEVEDLNLENSGFNDYSSQSRNKKFNDKSQRIRPPLAVNFEINQQNEKQELQQSDFGSLYSQKEKLETFDEANLTQQKAGQINFGAESQVGRQFTPHTTAESGKLNVDSQQNLKSDTQNLDLGQSNQHPVEHHIENLSQHHEQFSLTHEASHFNNNFEQPNIENQADKISTTIRYAHDLLPTLRPTLKPAPKPIPRYTRPWQVSQLSNVPKKLETEEKKFETDNEKIEESVNLENLDKHPDSLRGDLPGVSETSTVLTTTEKLDNNQQINSEYDSRQQFEQANLNVNSQLDDLQKSRNDWVQSNNRDGQYGQTNYFNKQSSQNNYEHSQQSNYYNQQSNGQELNPSNYQPLQEQNGNVQQQESLTHELESDQLGRSSQENFRQQVQIPSFEVQSSRFEDTKQREEEIAERVIPLEETKTISISDVSEEQTTTAPPSFWKRVGHKLSNSFDKAKEKARNIFG